jgi:hypothetical protein
MQESNIKYLEEATRLKKSLEESSQSLSRVLDEINGYIYTTAPYIVHSRLCQELVNVTRKNPGSLPKDIPEGVEILKAIDVLNKYYNINEDKI